MNFLLPENVSFIIDKLTAAGYEAYAVGGCVRDTLLGTEPKDWDITTSAEPLEIKELFRRTVDTGIKHGTVTVMIGDEGYETTTYRLDGKYEDARHPSNVTFTKCLSEDLLRRDFTINAMAYNDKTGLVDLFGGKEDLENGIIRCVGEPLERFGEDALRILRAYRFSARLGFTIEPATEAAAKQLAGNLTKISYERIRDELSKLLLSPSPERFTDLYEAGITDVVLPEINTFLKQKNACEELKKLHRTLCEAGFSEHSALAYAWGTVCAAAGDSLSDEERRIFAAEIMRKLKFDNDSIKLASGLARYCKFVPEFTEEAVRRTMNLLGPSLYEMWLVYRGDAKELTALTKTVRERGDCVTLKDLALTGKDLLDLGCQPGTAVGDCLNRLLDKVLAEPGLNTRESLTELGKNYISRQS